STGLYHIHAYSYETGKPVFVAKTTTTVTNLPDKTGRVNVSAVDTNTNTFKTTVRDVSSRAGLKSIRVAVWSDSNGQDDLKWYTASKQANGSYEAITHLSTHGYVNGKYHVHVYYQLNDGRMSALSASTTVVSGVVAKEQQKSYYNQADPRWKNKYYGRYTMDDAGCVPTVLAMIYSDLEGKTILPTEVATWLYNNTAAFNKVGPGTFQNGIGSSVRSQGYLYDAQTTLNELENTLKNGYHVAAAVGLGNFVWYGGTHEILLQGYDNGKTFVRDPYRDFLNGWYSIADLFKQQSWNPADRELGSPFLKIYKA
ncbi:GBS Bsp-like repeat-containing protein, partial [Streptococcus pluranimalium]